jgi:hypothetical protein
MFISRCNTLTCRKPLVMIGTTAVGHRRRRAPDLEGGDPAAAGGRPAALRHADQVDEHVRGDERLRDDRAVHVLQRARVMTFCEPPLAHSGQWKPTDACTMHDGQPVSALARHPGPVVGMAVAGGTAWAMAERGYRRHNDPSRGRTAGQTTRRSERARCEDGREFAAARACRRRPPALGRGRARGRARASRRRRERRPDRRLVTRRPPLRRHHREGARSC